MVLYKVFFSDNKSNHRSLCSEMMNMRHGQKKKLLEKPEKQIYTHMTHPLRDVRVT